MSVGTQPPRPRRTQDERRAKTRRRLLDATIQSLLDVGYARTTSRRVAELAGVSQGAQTHHFPYRVDLIGAALEHLVNQRIEGLREHASDLPQGRGERAGAVLDLLWADFSSDLFTIVIKLWVAAADDHALYERLVPIERQLAREIVGILPELLGDHQAPKDLRARVTVALAATRGLALSRAYEPAGRRPRNPWPQVRTVLELLLSGDDA